MTITEFLLARIAEDEDKAGRLMSDLASQIADEGYGADENGPFTPTRMLRAQLWAQYDGQSRWRNFARGQYIAQLADPARVLAECKATRAIVAEWNDYVALVKENVGFQEETLEYESRSDAILVAIRALAAVYSDHPDYSPEW